MAKRLQAMGTKDYENIWMGVTVEANDYMTRVDYLRSLDIKVKFLSVEPLIDSVDKMDYTNIDWVIVGGESGYVICQPYITQRI